MLKFGKTSTVVQQQQVKDQLKQLAEMKAVLEKDKSDVSAVKTTNERYFGGPQPIAPAAQAHTQAKPKAQGSQNHLRSTLNNQSRTGSALAAGQQAGPRPPKN